MHVHDGQSPYRTTLQALPKKQSKLHALLHLLNRLVKEQKKRKDYAFWRQFNE